MFGIISRGGSSKEKLLAEGIPLRLAGEAMEKRF